MWTRRFGQRVTPLTWGNQAERRCDGLRSATLDPEQLTTRAPPATEVFLMLAPPDRAARTQALRDLLESRIAVLDGAWGTMLQGAKLTPEDYRGERLRPITHSTSPATPTCST